MSDAQPIQAPPESSVMSVSQLHGEVLAALTGANLARVWVRGVITGLRQGPRFTSWDLVEYGADAAQVQAVLAVGAFRRQAGEIAAVLRDAGLELADGLEVAVWGRLDPNPAFGRLRLLAEGIDARATVGAAVLARDQVVAELEASGELAAQQRLTVPAVIARLGLISSPAAAGRADVLAVLARAPLAVHIVESPAAMAGPRVAAEVARSMAYLAGADVDLILVARGGGARSDLAPWDSAELARAIARCPTPVWVALGHASDRTVADMAAHRSHPAPSAAAAAVVATVEAGVQRRVTETAAAHHDTEMAAARRRLRYAVIVVAVVTLVLVALVWGTAR